jgi:hypothetical protein
MSAHITLELPPEFVELCEGDGVAPKQVLRDFIADLCGAKLMRPSQPIDRNLARVILALVDKVGMHNLLLALAGVAYTKSIRLLAEEPDIAERWRLVAVGLEGLARRRLRGLT